MIVYAVYTALVLAALAALFTSTAPYAAPWTLAGAAVLSAFILGYVQYAEKEWAKWPATAWTPLAALLYFMLFSSLVVNFAVQIAVAAAVITVAALTRGVTLWGPGGPIRSVIRAGRIAPWGLLVGSPLVLFVAGYELYRMYRQAPLAALAAVAGLALAAYAPPPQGAVALDAKMWMADVALWPGLIAWEEAISRAALPLFGWAANYLFVVLHAPKFIAYSIIDPAAPLYAPLALAVISFVTRKVTELYEEGGLVAAITAHALYNGLVGWLYYWGYWDVFLISSVVTIVWWLAARIIKT